MTYRWEAQSNGTYLPKDDGANTIIGGTTSTVNSIPIGSSAVSSIPMSNGASISTLTTPSTNYPICTIGIKENGEVKMQEYHYAYDGLNFVLFSIGIAILMGISLIVYHEINDIRNKNKEIKLRRKLEKQSSQKP